MLHIQCHLSYNENAIHDSNLIEKNNATFMNVHQGYSVNNSQITHDIEKDLMSNVNV